VEHKTKLDSSIALGSRHPDEALVGQGYTHTIGFRVETADDSVRFEDVHVSRHQLEQLQAAIAARLQLDSQVPREHSRADEAILDISSSRYLYRLRHDDTWLTKVHFYMLTKHNQLTTPERMRVLNEVLAGWEATENALS
jgi:hypothetical protein